LPRPPRRLQTANRPASAQGEDEDLGLDTDNWLRAYRKSVRTHPSIESALEYFKKIFDEAPAPYLITNLELIVTDANNAAQRMLGRSLVILREKPLLVVVDRGDRVALRDMTTELLNGQSALTRPLRIRPFRQTPLEIVVSACVCCDGDGVPECIFWIFLHPLDRLNEDLL
jgi:PAS domain-containing protein